MHDLTEIIYWVFTQAAVGGTALLGLSHLHGISPLYLRLNSVIFLILALIGAFAHPSSVHLATAFARPDSLVAAAIFAKALFLVFLGLYTADQIRRGGELGRGLWIAATLSGVAVLSLGALVFHGRVINHVVSWSLPFQFIVSSGVLGSVILGMILGHWYLAAKPPPIEAIRQVSIFFMTFMALQTLLTVVNVATLSDSGLLSQAVHLSSFEGLFFWIRVLVGVLGPMILSVMIYKTVAIRATQSATGLLYVTMLLIVGGEAASRFFLVMGSILL